MEIKKCEICGKEINTDTHHINSISKGGKNHNSNKCELCPNCHRQVHNGEIILEGKYLVSCNETTQIELVWRRKGEESITGLNDPVVWTYNDNKKVVDVKSLNCFYRDDELF